MYLSNQFANRCPEEQKGFQKYGEKVVLDVRLFHGLRFHVSILKWL